MRSDTGDFVGSSQIAVFTVGGSSQLSVTFTATDDIIPEPDETFIFDLSVIKGTATLATPSFTSVTILLNDNARGMFGFQQVCLNRYYVVKIFIKLFMYINCH